MGSTDLPPFPDNLQSVPEAYEDVPIGETVETEIASPLNVFKKPQEEVGKPDPIVANIRSDIIAALGKRGLTMTIQEQVEISSLLDEERLTLMGPEYLNSPGLTISKIRTIGSMSTETIKAFARADAKPGAFFAQPKLTSTKLMLIAAIPVRSLKCLLLQSLIGASEQELIELGRIQYPHNQ